MYTLLFPQPKFSLGDTVLVPTGGLCAVWSLEVMLHYVRNAYNDILWAPLLALWVRTMIIVEALLARVLHVHSEWESNRNEDNRTYGALFLRMLTVLGGLRGHYRTGGLVPNCKSIY